MRRTMTSGSSGGGSGSGWLPFSLNSIPVVRGVLIATVVSFLVYFFVEVTTGTNISQWLVMSFDGRGDLTWLLRPWSWVTYPVITHSIIALIFGGFWFYMVGGVLERSWGSRNFAILFAAFSAICVFGLVLGGWIFDVRVLLMGLWLPSSALLVAWAAMDPDQEIRFYGIFPVKLKLLALIDVVIIYVSYGMMTRPWGPLFGLFALLGPAAAYLYVRKMPRLDLSLDLPFRARREPARQPYLRIPPEDRERVPGFDPLRKRREQEEIARLRRLLGEDDDDRPTARR